jgi:hypothetical protein
VDTGQETKVAAKLVAKPKNGKLTLLSEPAGMQVVVDSDKTYATPASIELPAGEHSIEPKETSIGNAYYAAQPLQRITLPSGGEIKVPIKLTQETATLVIKLAPPGYKVIVNDQGKGETPVSKLVVAAGKNLIRFEAQGKPTRSFTVNPYPGKTVVVAWGITKETAVRLTRKTILLDGKTDSWDGIEPIDDESGFNFLGEEQYGIKSLYLCRDDAYLYWRIDFNAANPLYSKPKKTPDKNVVALQLAFGYKVECQLNLWVASNAGGNTLGDPYLGEYLKTRDGFDLASGKIMRGSNIGKSGDLAYLSSKSMIVGRVKYSQVSPKYLAGIIPLWAWLGEYPTISEELKTHSRYVDFSE